MMSKHADLEATLRDLRRDLTFAQAKVTAALEQLAAIPAPPTGDRPCCPLCGIERHADAMTAHMVNVHGLYATVGP